jgi:hypothetical protein
MPRGQKFGGRKAGTPNKTTAAAKQAMASLEAAMGDRLENVRAHDVLKLIYRDREQPLAVRMSAAATAIRYEAPTMQSTQVDLTVSNVPIHRWSDAELHEFISQERARLGLPAPDGQPLTIDGDCVENPKSDSL